MSTKTKNNVTRKGGQRKPKAKRKLPVPQAPGAGGFDLAKMMGQMLEQQTANNRAMMDFANQPKKSNIAVSNADTELGRSRRGLANWERMNGPIGNVKENPFGPDAQFRQEQQANALAEATAQAQQTQREQKAYEDHKVVIKPGTPFPTNEGPDTFGRTPEETLASMIPQSSMDELNKPKPTTPTPAPTGGLAGAANTVAPTVTAGAASGNPLAPGELDAIRSRMVNGSIDMVANPQDQAKFAAFRKWQWANMSPAERQQEKNSALNQTLTQNDLAGVTQDRYGGLVHAGADLAGEGLSRVGSAGYDGLGGFSNLVFGTRFKNDNYSEASKAWETNKLGHRPYRLDPNFKK
tara:strand:- start:24212 stop:25264 length:1053 start_codon:yes stop_codon:yes gene_type:complete